MHNFAVCLNKKGHEVTGSDDEIFDPAKSRLEDLGLLPDKMGWDASRISQDIDAVILGMHAREDNPELLRAQELGLKIYSFPEYVYEQSKDKKRVVIGGSHGKTTITAMIMHVLQFYHQDFDYLIGAQLEGFDTMVKLTNEAPIIILEGDEYLSSPIDKRPKFHLYHPHLALLSGIAWDHINVFPTFEKYKEQFMLFLDTIEEKGVLAYCARDRFLEELCEQSNHDITKVAYKTPDYVIIDGVTHIRNENGITTLQIIGEHNLKNMEGAKCICEHLGISNEDFYAAISSFKGAAKRLELMAKNEHSSFYKDFAHSPSKLKATVHAVKDQYPDRKLVACVELHTFSSLNKDYLSEYNDSMTAADESIVYFNPKTIEHKKLEAISEKDIKNAFQKDDLKVYTDVNNLFDDLKGEEWFKRNLLMMSSGNFDGMDLGKLEGLFN